MVVVCPSFQPDILHAELSTLDITQQTFQAKSFILFMCLGKIEFYHFMPLSVTLTLDEGHKVGRMQKLLVSNTFSPDHDKV